GADYLRAHDLDAAVTALAGGRWRILAGGTDLFPALQDRPLDGAVLDVSAIPELTRITNDDQGWYIGAAVTWQDIVHANLPAAFDGLKAAAREVGSVQIQNRATLVGNLCNASPAADGVPPLLTLDAEVLLRSSAGARQLPLGQFILGNRKTALAVDEMVSGLFVPAASATGQSGFYKLGARRYLVISIGMVAARLVVDDAGVITDAAVAVGACSAVAMRLPNLDAALRGCRLADAPAAVDAACLAALTPIDDVRGSAVYRRQAIKAAITRLLGSNFAGGHPS
ncbi:MAG: FAD binding domain-containing protein, partial [Candidatus Puniceispirillum sp.]